MRAIQWCLKTVMSLSGCAMSYTKRAWWSASVFSTASFSHLYLFFKSLPALFKTCNPHLQVAHRERFVQGEAKLTENVWIFESHGHYFPSLVGRCQGCFTPLCTTVFACLFSLPHSKMAPTHATSASNEWWAREHACLQGSLQGSVAFKPPTNDARVNEVEWLFGGWKLMIFINRNFKALT